METPPSCSLSIWPIELCESILVLLPCVVDVENKNKRAHTVGESLEELDHQMHILNIPVGGVAHSRPMVYPRKGHGQSKTMILQ